MELSLCSGFGSMQGHIDREFWSSLMKLDEVEVAWLKDKDVWRTTKNWYEAFANDPLQQYINSDEKETPRRTLIHRITIACTLHAWRRTKITITVNHGSSLVIATLPTASPKPKDVLLNWFADTVMKIRNKNLDRKEQEKRATEFRTKTSEVISERIGDRKEEMIYVSLVFTAQGSQGHGYASALLGTITKLADVLGQACWLVKLFWEPIIQIGMEHPYEFKSW
ncbi:hypothetical protein H1R20_g2929, partial [Candolleomyces eurysporus]